MREIVYETHRHSSIPYVPNYPPQQVLFFEVPILSRSYCSSVITFGFDTQPLYVNFIQVNQPQSLYSRGACVSGLCFDSSVEFVIWCILTCSSFAFYSYHSGETGMERTKVPG